jgi:uncharacterized membrane protein YbhN (UPF0104 family)
LAGVAIGGALLWLALRGTSAADLVELARQVQFRWVALAMLLYGTDLMLRTGRWRALLRGLKTGAAPPRYCRLGEVLVVGYAVNNVLPARLGEFFRADYAGKRLGLNRATVFGTIVIERLLDAVVVAGGLCIGLAVLGSIEGGIVSGYREPLAIIAGCGAAAIIAVVAIIAGVLRQPRLLDRLLDRLPPTAGRLGGQLLHGLGCFRHAGLCRVVVLSLLIWLCEGAAIWSLVRAADVSLGPGQTVVLVGALSLGTLVPTAPAYLGSYQLIFGLCLASFGLPSAVGVFGAALVQVFLLGPVTLAGLLLYSAKHVVAAMRLATGGADASLRAG